MNQGKTYLVQHLDLSSKIAWCQRADVKYYTKTRDYTDIHVIGGDVVCNFSKANYFLFFPSLLLLLSFALYNLYIHSRLFPDLTCISLT